MANEIKVSYSQSQTVYVFILNKTGQIYNTSSALFEAYNSANLALYTVSLVQQGGSSLYLGTFPPAIPNGTYDLLAKAQKGGTPAESDPTIGNEDGFGWNGSTRIGFSDIPISGFTTLINIARGTMVKPFPIYLRSSIDHVTPFVSGIVSGQIAKDGGAFAALQSGAFVEQGLGFYSLQCLTSGDTSATAIALMFTATGISGGTSDPLPLGIITQHASGY
jgi:hypothetical protein